MKIIIEAHGIKRELEGPFRICGSRDDLTLINDQLDSALEGKFSYGWCVIHESMPLQEGPNTTPRKWTE